MINTIVFDVGQVLLAFDPLGYLKGKYKDHGLVEKLYKNIFKSKEWGLLDRGDITVCDAVAAMCERDIPNSSNINDIMSIWTDILVPIDRNVNIVYKLKEKSYKLYLLSNFPSEAFSKVEKKHKFFKAFDGKVISAHVHYNKPEKEIYNLLLKNFNILPENALFIDDMNENILGASSLGFNTIHFKPDTDLEEELKKLSLLD